MPVLPAECTYPRGGIIPVQERDNYPQIRRKNGALTRFGVAECGIVIALLS